MRGAPHHASTPEQATANQPSEERLALLARLPGDVLCLLDREGKLVYVSGSVERTFGYTPEQFAALISIDLVHLDDRELLRTTWNDLLQDPGREHRIEFRIADAAGNWRWVEAVVTNHLDDPELQAVVFNYRDISERVATEQALRSSEEWFRALADHSADGFVVANAEGTIVYSNQAIEEILGYRPDQIVGRDGEGLLHPDDTEVFERLRVAASKPGNKVTVEARARHRDGSYRWLSISVVNLLDNPHINGVLCNFRDITEAHQTQEALRASETRFRTVIQNSYDVTAVVNDHGTVKWVTPNLVNLLGYRPEEVEGTSGFDYVHPDDQDLMASELAKFIAGEGVPNPMTIQMRHRNGTWRYIEIVGTSFLDNPDIEGIAVNLRAVDERVRAERDRQRLLDIFELTDDLVGISAADGAVVYLNRAAKEFLGVASAEELTTIDLAERFSPKTLNRLGEEMSESLRLSGSWSGEVEVIDRAGRRIPMIAQLLAHRDDHGEIEFLSGILHDISRRKQLERRLQFQATHDPLTGLPNRTLLLDRLKHALARSQRERRSVAVLFCDLDHFKAVNDELGHSQGDQVLVRIARRLEQELRPGDTIARFGGDEFVVLCEGIAGPDEAVAIANRVVNTLKGAVWVKGVDPVGVSIGVAICSDGRAEPETLIRDADAAMYRAKSRGRGRIELFHPVSGTSSSPSTDIAESLLAALEHQELTVEFQPAFDLRDGAVASVEALVRWNHPRRGRLTPAAFLHAVAETTIANRLDDFVLHRACRAARRWESLDPGHGIRVTVNVSAREFTDPELIAVVEQALSDTGLSGTRLQIEVPEAVLMGDITTAHAVLQALMDLGVTVVVDDFGRGFSPPASLRRLQVDTLKIDRSLVEGVATNPEHHAVLRAMVSMAHSLGIRVVAKGVETQEQLDSLTAIGCDLAQGFFLQRPVPEDAMTELLRAAGHS